MKTEQQQAMLLAAQREQLDKLLKPFAEAVYEDTDLSIQQKIDLLEMAKPGESAYESCQSYLKLLRDENLLDKIF